jgi:hypothetical protein
LPPSFIITTYFCILLSFMISVCTK